MREQVQLKEHVQLNCREHACRQEIVSSFFERCKARGFCIILVGYGVREGGSMLRSLLWCARRRRRDEMTYFFTRVQNNVHILNMACRTIEDPEPYYSRARSATVVSSHTSTVDGFPKEQT